MHDLWLLTILKTFCKKEHEREIWSCFPFMLFFPQFFSLNNLKLHKHKQWNINKLTSGFLCTCPLIDDKLHHKLTVWQLKVKLESLHYLKLYLPLLLLMIGMSQSAWKKLDSYCGIFLCKKKLLRLLLTFNPLLAVTDFWTKLEKNIAGLRICSSTSRRKQDKLLIQKYLTVPDYYVNSFSVLLFVCLFFERFGIRI